jgi:hypothetical protein
MTCHVFIDRTKAMQCTLSYELIIFIVLVDGLWLRRDVYHDAVRIYITVRI